MTLQPTTKILVLGAGELGTAFIPHLAALPHTHITVAVRTPSKYANLQSTNVSLLGLDLGAPSEILVPTFADFDIVVSCTGFGQPPDTLTKLANEILAAGEARKTTGRSRLWFFPWQWGVDYDVTGDGEGKMPVFGAQVQVRKLLREKAEASNVKWTIISTGMFMSFLFENWWGVVQRGEEGKITVRALRDWNHKVTVTDVDDIGKVLARVIAGDVEANNRVLYAAGDTVSYGQLAEIVERATGDKVQREEWSIPYLENELTKDPENGTLRYRLVFARDGVWWDKKVSLNQRLGIASTDVETYASRIL
jgi:uncharacterized protein YbjT (DUF2867 family)